MSDIKAVLQSRSNNDYSLIERVSEYIVLMETDQNNAIKKILTDKQIKKAYLNYLEKQSSDTQAFLYKLYLFTTNRNMIMFIRDLSLNGKEIQTELLDYIKGSASLKPYIASIYTYFHIKFKKLVSGKNSSTLFLSNKNAEGSEYMNEFLENVGISDYSSIMKNFTDFKIFNKNSASPSIVFTAVLKSEITKEMNSVRDKKGFFNRQVYFKVFPKDIIYEYEDDTLQFKKKMNDLEFEKDMYEQLFKLVKYNVTPNILCKVATSDISNFTTNFYDKLNEEQKKACANQINGAMITIGRSIYPDFLREYPIKEQINWNKTSVIMTQPGGGVFVDLFPSLSDKDRMKVMFQLVYTLYVFENLEISQGDLHHGNIFIIDVPETKLCYRVKEQLFCFKTTKLVKIYDFDRGTICKDSFIIYNTDKTVRIHKLLNESRKPDGSLANFTALTTIFNKNLDKVQLFLPILQYCKGVTLDAEFNGTTDIEFSNFLKRNLPGIDSDNTISNKKVEETYIKEFVPETVTCEIGVDISEKTKIANNNKNEAERIFNVNEEPTDVLKTICSFNIDKDILNSTWLDYFFSILPIRMIKKNKKYKSNNHLWIPDVVIMTNLDMMNDDYFQSLRSGNEDYNVYSDIIYTVDKLSSFKPGRDLKKIKKTENDS